MHVERLQRVSIVSGEEISRDKHREKKKMYPGPPSTLLSNQQKKPVNRYDYQPLKQQDRIGTASYHQPQLYGGMKPFGKRMSSQLQVELTLRDPYLKNSNAKPRLKWSLELQDRFVQSVDALGGEKYATPKKILLLMNAPGLTLNHLKSHLQKYRIALKAEQKPVALPPPPRRPRANPKKKTSARSAASGCCGSSGFTKKTGANKWKAESSKARKQNGNKQVKIQDVEMAMEGTSKSTGSNEATIASAFTSSTSVANHAIGAYAFPSARGKEPANQTMGNHIIGASAFASAKGKEPAIQTMGNNIIGASAFSSSKGKEPATDFETDPYPFRPTIFDIQFESYYPIHYSREEVIVRNGNVAGASVKEQIAFYEPLGQASISRNLAYLNHSSPDSNSSFQLTGHGTILANYQMDTRSSFSSMFENSMETGSSFSSTFVEVDTGSNLSPMSENSMETGSTVSSMFGNFSSSLSSTFNNSVDTGSSFSSRFWNSADPGPSSSSMFANPMERGSSFSVTANPITEPGLGFSPVTENPNPMEPGLSFPSMTANLMNPGLSFPSMGTGSSQTSMFGDPLDTVGSSLCSTFGNSTETGLSFSSVFGDSIDPGTSISNLDENGLITGDFGLDSGDFFHGITGMFQ